jgi:hypothetical protein
MGTLVAELRTMIDAGTADYTVGTVSYWTDDQLQTILDVNRAYVNYQAVDGIPNYGTATTYTLYPTGAQWWEEVTVQEAGGGTISAGTSTYSFDPLTGWITFVSDQAGSARYVTGYVYNLYGAARDVWNKKAGHYVTAYDFSTDNHSVKRSQLMAQAKDAARMYGDLAMTAQPGGMAATMDRVDS